MPATYTTPGVYVEELPSGVHPITGVSTSETAFVDFFARGKMNTPINVTSMADFERVFGGLDQRSEASYAIWQYFTNGGTSAWVVRVAAGTPEAAHASAHGGAADSLDINASSEGTWGAAIQYAIDYDQVPDSDSFNLTVREVSPADNPTKVVTVETFRNLKIITTDPQFAPAIVNGSSRLVNVSVSGAAVARPDDTTKGSDPHGSDPQAASDPKATAFISTGAPPNTQALTGGNDGTAPDVNAFNSGIDALDQMAPFIFNLLCLPGAAKITASFTEANYQSVLAHADTYCEQKRAFLLVDPESTTTSADAMVTLAAGSILPKSKNGAVYFPRVKVSDPLMSGQPRDIAPSGTVAGVTARIDASRGVWKSPAGTEASVLGVTLDVVATDAQSGKLNMLGVNAMRSFPIYGDVVWGARTLVGADAQASEWKYVAVRRTALYIEESLVQGLKWAVFEPNDERLWAELRLNVGAFLNGMFRQGAFKGTTPSEAYFVKCDKDTTTQGDIDRGVVNVLVGFSPLKPAEFVVIQIQQMAGQTQA